MACEEVSNRARSVAVLAAGIGSVLFWFFGGDVARKVLTTLLCMPAFVGGFACLSGYFYILCVGCNSIPLAPRDLKFGLALLAAVCLSLVTHPLCWVASVKVPWWLPAGCIVAVAFVLWLLQCAVTWTFLADPLMWGSSIDAEVKDGPELEQMRALFQQQCAAYAHKYDFGLELQRVYRVKNESLQHNFDDFKDRMKQKRKKSNIQGLFHATSAANARSIVKAGFQLPQHGGMFGRGVYFANCPLKSWQYYGWPGAMLVCDVELGQSRVKSSSGCNPEVDLKPGFLGRLVGQRSYDSLTAQDGLLGCVRVPEFVIYKPEQAMPCYVLKVKRTTKD